MRKIMVLVLMALALAAGAQEFGSISLQVKPGSTVGDVFFAHPEAQSLGLYVYSKEYHAAWEKVDGPTDFNKLRPGFHNFPVSRIVEQEAIAAKQPAPTNKTAEGVENEPEPKTVEPTGIIEPRKQYEPSGLVELNFNQYTQVEWPPATQRPELSTSTTLEKSVAGQIASHIDLVQEPELFMPKTDASFEIKAEDKIAEQNQAVYQRLSKRSYPRESFLVAKLPYLILGGTLIITIILSIILVRRRLKRWFEDHYSSQPKQPSPREAELEVRVTHLERELNIYQERIFIFTHPGLKRRADLSPLKDLTLEVRGKNSDGIPLVFVPGLDELVPARPLIVEGALRRAQELLGEKCPYIIPDNRTIKKKPNLKIIRPPAAPVAALR